MKWLRETDHKLLVPLLRLARDAVGRTPDVAKAWLNLARLQRLLGAVGEAEASLDAASATTRGDPRLQAALAEDLAAQVEPDRALVEVERALTALPHDPGMRRLRLKLLLATKRTTLAQATVRDGEPLDPTAFGALAMLRDRHVPPEELVSRCDEALAVRPQHTDALYHKAIALAQLGRTAEARAIMALEETVQTFVLPVPAGYDDGVAFRAALAAELLRNPTLIADPRYRSTRQGRQVTNPMQPDAHAIFDLIAQIEQAVGAYRAARPGLVAPSQAVLNVWGVVLGAGGFQTSHRHPVGWLSGVYYVAAPKLPRSNAYPGRLLIGKLSDDMAGLACWGGVEIEPVPGSLVLFPSYIPHATEPTGMAGERISVAFDVVPQAW